MRDSYALKNQLTKTNNDLDLKDAFPFFVYEFLTNKYVKKSMIEQHALDLLISVDFHKNIDKDIEIFSKFLTEEYNVEDLVFFLFVRSCIEKEMKFMFIEKAKEEMKTQYHEDRDEIDNDIYLNQKVCAKSKFVYKFNF